MTLSVVACFAIMSCCHVEPFVAVQTDRSSWVKIGTVSAINIPRIKRIMAEAKIPLWVNAEGYPYYQPVFVPPLYHQRAQQILFENGGHPLE